MRAGDARHYRAVLVVLQRRPDRFGHRGPAQAVGAHPKERSFRTAVLEPAHLQCHNAVLQGLMLTSGQCNRGTETD